MLFRVLDIETVSDDGAFTPREPKWSLVPEAPSPANYLPASVVGMAFRREDPWAPPQANRVVAISHLTLETAAAQEGERRYLFREMVSRAVWGPNDEAGLISDFGDVQTKNDATIVTWAGRSFDLPVLALRALKHGLVWGWYYNEKSVRYRYSDEGHCDLMDVLSDYGASRSLSLGDAARLVGLPGKTDMDGSKVADVVAKGEDKKAQAKIEEYCGHDVLQTALVFLRSRLLFGRLTLEGFRASAESFKPIVEEYHLNVNWKAYLLL